jgi:probable O-glycosylation ligase (exosortase A-associated)
MVVREAIFLPLIAAICLVAPFRPRVGLLGYIWFGLMRPDLLAFADGKYPYSLALAIGTGLGALRYAGRTRFWLRTPFCAGLWLLQIPIALSVIEAVRPELATERYQSYIRMILVLLLIPVLIDEVDQARRLLLVAAASLGFVALKFGLYGIAHGGAELSSGYGEMLADNNFLALAFAMAIPLAWQARAFTSSRMVRAGWIAVIGSAMAAIVMTSSRGGSVAMLVALCLVFRNGSRKWAQLALVVVLLAGAVNMVQDRYFDRMQTLANVHGEPSAESRFIHAATAWNMWLDYPLLGVGFGGYNYSALSPKYMDATDDSLANHVVHNSYLQMLVDSGVFAFLLYAGLLVYAIVWLGASARRMAPLGPEYEAMPLAIQGPLVVFAVGSAFYSCQRMDLPYLLLMTAAAWWNIERKLIGLSAPATETAGPWGVPVEA